MQGKGKKWQKIWANQESGLTSVQLMWDPPVLQMYCMALELEYIFVKDVSTVKYLPSNASFALKCSA